MNSDTCSSVECRRLMFDPPRLSWFPQQDAPLRFRCGYQPWEQVVSGEVAVGVGWWGGGEGRRGKKKVIDTCLSPHATLRRRETRACLHVWTRTLHLSHTHSLTKSLVHFQRVAAQSSSANTCHLPERTPSAVRTPEIWTQPAAQLWQSAAYRSVNIAVASALLPCRWRT